MNRVSIIGFGRFGAMLHSLLSKGFEVDVFDKNSIDNSDVNEVSLEDALQNETIFIAVPIRDFENLVKDISKKISSGKTVIDVCSVKVFPKKVMLDNLSNETDIALHKLMSENLVQPLAVGGLQFLRLNSSTTASSCDLKKGAFASAFSSLC